MKKPLHGIPLFLFRVWLYTPLIFLGYLDWAALVVDSPKVDLVPRLIGWGMSLLIFYIVLFNKEFRQFSRATPFRILAFFGLAFAIAEVFVIVLSALQEDLRVTMGLITIPAIYAFFFTPLLVMRFEVLLPKSQGNQSANQEPSEPPSAVI